MGRKALHSDTVKIEQKDDIVGNVKNEDRDSEIVLVDKPLHKDYLDALAFAEEPILIVLNPSTEKNAPNAYYVAVNGKGAEVFQNGRWDEIGYLPVGRSIIVKRKVVEIIIRAKIDRIDTQHDEIGSSENIINIVKRFTSAVHSFSILEDKNPRGAAWATEMIRRNM